MFWPDLRNSNFCTVYWLYENWTLGRITAAYGLNRCRYHHQRTWWAIYTVASGFLILSKYPGFGLCSLSLGRGEKSTQVNYSSQSMHLIEEAGSLQHVSKHQLKRLRYYLLRSKWHNTQITIDDTKGGDIALLNDQRQTNKHHNQSGPAATQSCSSRLGWGDIGSGPASGACTKTHILAPRSKIKGLTQRNGLNALIFFLRDKRKAYHTIVSSMRK